MLYWPGSHPQTSCLTISTPEAATATFDTAPSIVNDDLAESTRKSGHQQGDNKTTDQPFYATGVDGFILSVHERAPNPLVLANSGDT